MMVLVPHRVEMGQEEFHDPPPRPGINVRGRQLAACVVFIRGGRFADFFAENLGLPGKVSSLVSGNFVCLSLLVQGPVEASRMVAEFLERLADLPAESF